MIRDTQIGRMILEAVTGIHGDVARDVAQAWVTLSEQNQRLQSHIVELESRLELPENGKCDGIYCREQTIAAQDEIIGDLCKKTGCLEKENSSLKRIVSHLRELVGNLSEGYDGSIMSGNVVHIHFDTQDNACKWYESFTDTVDAMKSTGRN